MINLKKIPNLNYAWAALLVEELIRNNVTDFFISPGSRSSALTMAVAENKKAVSHIHFDERANAFQALGCSSATGKPSVIITTSGTAAANLYPAVIEASKKKVPLIILTADRPPELRNTGAHQTIDQVKMFGDYVRWQTDMPTPTFDISPEFVLTTIDQAIFRAKGELPGPVHINCMYREPLAPVKQQKGLKTYLSTTAQWNRNETVFTEYQKPKSIISKSDLKNTCDRLKKIKSGIIAVCKLKSTQEMNAVVLISKKLGWPIFPDLTSGLRFKHDANIVNYFDLLLSANTKVDGVLHIGGRITSKRFYDVIKQSPIKEYIMLLNHPLKNDPLHCVTQRIQTKVGPFLKTLEKSLKKHPKTNLLKKLSNRNAFAQQHLKRHFSSTNTLSEAQCAHQITNLIPKTHALFVSNSMPIRLIDNFAEINNKSLIIGSNRGASGIDGIIASAIGFSKGLNKPVTLLIGDLAALYDLNSLSIIHELSYQMTIIILNNQGGGIFSFLPIEKNNSNFQKYFSTPHAFNFKNAANMFHLNYKNPLDSGTFISTYTEALKNKNSTIIEIKTKRESNVKEYKKIRTALN